MHNYNYIEIAKETPRKRGVLIPQNELVNHLGDVPVYRSMYLYDSKAVDFADANNNSLRNYYGARAIDNILIDIDREQNTDDFTLRKCQGICYQLTSEFDLQSILSVYFSQALATI